VDGTLVAQYLAGGAGELEKMRQLSVARCHFPRFERGKRRRFSATRLAWP
jgi:hypothetical protein